MSVFKPNKLLLSEIKTVIVQVGIKMHFPQQSLVKP
jgi:hypothetical protein